MKTVFAIVATLAFVLSTTGTTSAHRRLHKLFVAAQVPVNSSKYHNIIIDSNLSEWDNVPSVYWVTQEDLIETAGSFNNPDASNLAVRDDDDSLAAGFDGYWTNSGVTEFYFRKDAMVDYLLAEFDESIWVPNPVISNDSWGRIKSTFSE